MGQRFPRVVALAAVAIPLTACLSSNGDAPDGGQDVATDHGVARAYQDASETSSPAREAGSPPDAGSDDAEGCGTVEPGGAGDRDGGKRDPAYWPFASDSPWNLPLATSAQYQTASDAETQDLQSAHHGYVNWQQYSVPVYLTKSADPMATLSFPNGYIDSMWVQTGSVKLRVPLDAAPSPGTDGDIFLITPDRLTGYESWRFSGSAPSYTTVYTVEQDLTGRGWGEGIHAAGCSLAGGLIRAGDLAALSIPHALASIVAVTQAKTPWVWPAVSQDDFASTSYSGQVPMGALLAIPPDVAVDQIATTAEGKALGHALQEYGAYVVDTAGTYGGVGFVVEPAACPAAANNLSNDVTVLADQLVVVTNNAVATPGGGAPGSARRAPLAPTIPAANGDGPGNDGGSSSDSSAEVSSGCGASCVYAGAGSASAIPTVAACAGESVYQSAVGTGGYASAFSDGTGGMCTTSSATACLDTSELCVSGTTGIASTSSPYNCYGAGLVLNVGQLSGSSTVGTYSVSASSMGINYTLSSFPTIPGGGMHLEVMTGTAAASATNTYCAPIAAAKGTVAWSSLALTCYGTPTGAALTGPPTDLQSVQFVVDDGTVETSFDICIDAITF
jgi:hypothetical protein